MRLWLTLIAILSIGLFTLQSIADSGTCSSKTVSVKGVAKGASCGSSCSGECTGSCSGACSGACDGHAETASAKTTTAKTVSVKGTANGASCGDSCTGECTGSCSDKAKTATTAKTVSVKGTAKGASCGDSCTGECTGSCGDKAKTASAKGACSGSCGSCSGSCGSSAKTSMVSGKGAKSNECLSACSSSLAANAPKMSFIVVNDGKTLLTTASPCSAKKAVAAKPGSTIAYQVADTKFDNEAAAYQAYAKQLEDFLGTMTKVSYVVDGKQTCCPDTAASMAKANHSKVEYRVASVNFKNAELANAAVKQAKKAIDGVQMKYVVEGKEFTCPHEAGESCTGAKEKMVYKVGESTTDSEATAKTALLRERINAAAAVVSKTAEEGQASANAS